MNTKKNFQDIDDLAREVVRLGREIADEASKLHVGGTATNAAFANCALEFLRERRPFDQAGEGGLATVQGILDEDILGEVIGTKRVFVPSHFDELGQDGEVHEMPVYSSRGAGLVRMRDLFQDFLEARETVLDHVAAHRALLKVMSS